MHVHDDRRNVTSNTHVRWSSGSSKLRYSWRSSGTGAGTLRLYGRPPTRPWILPDGRRRPPLRFGRLLLAPLGNRCSGGPAAHGKAGRRRDQPTGSVVAYLGAPMPAVEETAASRWARRSRHAVRLATTPRLWREQVEYLRHGPSPSAPLPGDVTFPASPWRNPPPGDGHYCNICGWQGTRFDGARHVEGQ